MKSAAWTIRPRPQGAPRDEADELIEWAARLHVTPEELRSAVKRGGEMLEEIRGRLEGSR